MHDFPDMVAKLRTAGRARHQAITLLWAIGNARHGRPRLVRWSAAQEPLRVLLAAHGLPTNKATPEYPFVALARSPWWELPDVDDVPLAHGSVVLTWLNTHDPLGGLRSDVYAAMSEEKPRAAAVDALLHRFFLGVDTSGVLRATGLADPERDRDVHLETSRGPGRRSPSSLDRIIADLANHYADATPAEVIAAFSDEIADLAEKAPEPEGDAFEGRLLLLIHRARERDRKKREEKIAQVLAATGCLECEVCGFDFARTYGERGERYAEVHHRVPLHVSGETSTRLADLAVLCANCHRMIHRRRDWLTPEELREIMRGQ